jgi:phospholipase C
MLMRATTAVLLAAAANAQSQSPATPIKHVVVIFQENVSFDHYFATYPNASNINPGEPVFTASPDTPTINGLTPALLTHNPNSVQPFRLPRTQSAICDQDHDYGDEQRAYNGGAANQFVETVGGSTATCNSYGAGNGIVMSYYDGNTLTALWNYAQHFAMSDDFFSTVFGPSTLGHLNLVSGQTHGAVVVNGQPPIIAGTVVGDARPAYDDCVAATAATISMSGKNVGDLLNVNGIAWGWFAGGFKPASLNVDGTAAERAEHDRSYRPGQPSVTTSPISSPRCRPETCPRSVS